jgi:hypothetical protein
VATVVMYGGHFVERVSSLTCSAVFYAGRKEHHIVKILMIVRVYMIGMFCSLKPDWLFQDLSSNVKDLCGLLGVAKYQG